MYFCFPCPRIGIFSCRRPDGTLIDPVSKQADLFWRKSLAIQRHCGFSRARHAKNQGTSRTVSSDQGWAMIPASHCRASLSKRQAASFFSKAVAGVAVAHKERLNIADKINGRIGGVNGMEKLTQNCHQEPSNKKKVTSLFSEVHSRRGSQGVVHWAIGMIPAPICLLY